MTIEEAITSHLTTNAGVAALVASRVYPKQMPQAPTYPAIVYHRISGPREHSQTGSSGLAHPRFQFDLYARSYAGAKNLSEKVRLAFDDFRGSMGGGSGVEVDAVFLEDDGDDYDDDLQVYMFRVDYTFWHGE